MTPRIKANVLILGKTGVGKTALFNYLFGQELLKTGAGRPVTGMGLFEEEVALESGLVLHLFDSWGMEADKTESWKNVIDDALKDHQGGRIDNWFHTIIFCISAKSARVEAFEVEMIEDLKKRGNPVIIALTHADVSEKKGAISVMRQVFLDKGIFNADIIEVSSVGKTLLGGRKTKAFGKEEILRQIQTNLLKMIIERIPQTLQSSGEEKINGWFDDCRHIMEKDVSFFNPVSQKKEQQRNAFFNDYAAAIFNEIIDEANTLFYQATDYFLVFSQCVLGGALVATAKRTEMAPFIQFRLQKKARLTTEIMGNVFTFIPVLGAFGKQIIRKKSQAYYLQGLKENKALLENQLNEMAKKLQDELGKMSRLLGNDAP